MKLIDADALIKDLEYDVELNARALDDTDLLLGRDRELVQFDKDCKQNAVDMLKEASEINAIPVEWIDQFVDKNRGYISRVTITWLLDDWRAEQRRRNEE